MTILAGTVREPHATQDPAARRLELERRFCELFVERERLTEQRRAIQNDLMRIQGAIQELDRLSTPDRSGPASPGRDGDHDP